MSTNISSWSRKDLASSGGGAEVGKARQYWVWGESGRGLSLFPNSQNEGLFDFRSYNRELSGQGGGP
jgi:hypothetical protein